MKRKEESRNDRFVTRLDCKEEQEESSFYQAIDQQ
jgi:hypothetical protein